MGYGRVFANRRDAGRQLAALVRGHEGRAPLVLGLPRGGVPVAAEVAQALAAPLDIYMVRKIGVPGNEELAMGAIATGGAVVRNEPVLRSLHIDDVRFVQATAEAQEELRRRERLYRGSRPPLALRDRDVIVVDDGLATGATMKVAIRSIRQHGPARIVVAVPVAAPEVCEALAVLADEMICAITPEPLFGVGLWYADFSPTLDAEVLSLLEQAAERERGGRVEATAAGRT